MNAPVALRLDSEVSECGDLISGVVSIVDTNASLSSLQVSLVATVTTRAPSSSTAPALVTSGPVSLKANTPMVFELSVPTEGPISFEGSTISASWAVEVASSNGKGVLLRQKVTILPAGGLAVWARHGAPPPQPTDGQT